MQLFSGKSSAQAPASDQAGARREALEARHRRWRQECQEVLGRLQAARNSHAQAVRTYNRYAPGPQKDAAGSVLNQAADRLREVQREYSRVEMYEVWDRNN